MRQASFIARFSMLPWIVILLALLDSLGGPDPALAEEEAAAESTETAAAEPPAPETPAPPPAWEVTLALGANLTKGNSDTLAANASLLGKRVSERHEIALGADGNYGESEGVTTSEFARGLADYKRKFPSFYLFSKNSIAHDKIAAIDYRLILGLGLGKFLVDSERHKLGLEGGLAYVKERFQEVLDLGGPDEREVTESDDSLSVIIAQTYEMKISTTSKLWESVEYLPQADDFSLYLLSAKLGVEAAMTTRLSLRVALEDRFDSEPPAGKDRNDVSAVASLVLKMGRLPAA